MRYKTFIKQAVKYGLVGLSNTAITLLIIFLLSNLLNFHYMVANAIGYTAGFINSFILNRAWTFQASHNSWHFQFFKFLGVTAVCYALQLGFLYLLVDRLKVSENYAQIIAMIFYTAISFIINKIFVFTHPTPKESDL